MKEHRSAPQGVNGKGSTSDSPENFAAKERKVRKDFSTADWR
jgi:hypothetical protein